MNKERQGDELSCELRQRSAPRPPQCRKRLVCNVIQNRKVRENHQVSIQGRVTLKRKHKKVHEKRKGKYIAISGHF